MHGEWPKERLREWMDKAVDPRRRPGAVRPVARPGGSGNPDGAIRRNGGGASGELSPSTTGRRLQRPLHALGVAGDDRQVGAGGWVGFGAALFPVAQRTERDVIPRGELLLGEVERPADQLGLGRALHPREIGVGQGLRVGIVQRRSVAHFGAHRVASSVLLKPCRSIRVKPHLAAERQPNSSPCDPSRAKRRVSASAFR